ncbi:hypothetical protein FNAPI_6149 [Fusarium napiforme]|uniref:Uncharacterized protein n=1 Tax=Fusarium napiforme TaxID=42672 RepID=A0A8H5N862_9HYPO|nr:hypothetical protein FNAPI_6149 [Fusarium napiforme]
MDPIYREKLAYSLGKFLDETYRGEGRSYNSVHVNVPVDLDHKDIKETLATLDPEDFLSQAIRYYQHCSLDPKSHQDENRLIEIKERLDEKFGEYLLENNLLKYTAQKNWLEEAIKIPTHGSRRRRGWRYWQERDEPTTEVPDEKPRAQLKYTIDREMEELTGVQKQSRPKDMELLTLCPGTIERSFLLLKPFDYTERYSLHYILLRKYSGDKNMTHMKADREARIRLEDYKAEHFERMCEESRQLSQWEEREKVRDWKYWKEIEHNPDDLISEDDLSSEDDWPEELEPEEEGYQDNESEGEESGGEESEDDGSESDETGGDGASNSAGMDIDLPEPTSENLATQISVLQISGKKSNGEGGGVTKTAKKRPFDDSDDTDDAAASGYKRTKVDDNAVASGYKPEKVENWRKRFDKYGWIEARLLD